MVDRGAWLSQISFVRCNTLFPVDCCFSVNLGLFFCLFACLLILWVFYFVFFCWGTGCVCMCVSMYVSLCVLFWDRVSMWHRQASNLWQFTHLSSPSVGIRGVSHPTRLPILIFLNFKTLMCVVYTWCMSIRGGQCLFSFYFYLCFEIELRFVPQMPLSTVLVNYPLLQ